MIRKLNTYWQIPLAILLFFVLLFAAYRVFAGHIEYIEQDNEIIVNIVLDGDEDITLQLNGEDVNFSKEMHGISFFYKYLAKKHIENCE